MKITSFSNPKFKALRKLVCSYGKTKEENLFFVEGIRELTMAIKGGYEAMELIFSERSIELDRLARSFDKEIELPFDLFKELLYRKDKSNVLGIFKAKDHSLGKLDLAAPLTTLVIDEVEKPGNIGAIIRSAEAFGVDLILMAKKTSQGRINIFHPHIIRASLGCVFIQKIYIDTKEHIHHFLTSHGYSRIIGTLIEKNTKKLSKIDLLEKGNRVAFVLGSEDKGLGEYWKEHLDEFLEIDMIGKVDSLNVSNAASILAYELLRQRLVKK